MNIRPTIIIEGITYTAYKVPDKGWYVSNKESATEGHYWIIGPKATSAEALALVSERVAQHKKDA